MIINDSVLLYGRQRYFCILRYPCVYSFYGFWFILFWRWILTQTVELKRRLIYIKMYQHCLLSEYDTIKYID